MANARLIEIAIENIKQLNAQLNLYLFDKRKVQSVVDGADRRDTTNETISALKAKIAGWSVLMPVAGDKI